MRHRGVLGFCLWESRRCREARQFWEYATGRAAAAAGSVCLFAACRHIVLAWSALLVVWEMGLAYFAMVLVCSSLLLV